MSADAVLNPGRGTPTGLPIGLAKHLDDRAPRYTSYPTALSFSEDIGPETHARWLAKAGEAGPISLYVHVPYCRSLCHYCGCHARVANKAERIAAHAAVLRREIALVRAHIAGDARVDAIHFGGGTPTMLAARDFSAIVDEVGRAFDGRGSWSLDVEADPRTLTPVKAEALAATGVRRVSMGVQDFSPRVQAAIGRVQCYALVSTAVTWLRMAGIENVGFDLMYGLPLQTEESVRVSALKAVSLEPDRLSVFGYAHVPHMRRGQTLMDEDAMPDASARWAQAEAIANVLKEAGYVEVGFDHFAKPDDPLARAARDGSLGRNFQGYTSDGADTLIAVGASGISRFAEGHIQNEPDLRLYEAAMRAGRLPSRRGVAFADEDGVRGVIIRDILCRFAVDVGARLAEFGRDRGDFDSILNALEDLEADGLVVRRRRDLVIPRDARRFARLVAARFDVRFAANGKGASRVV